MIKCIGYCSDCKSYNYHLTVYDNKVLCSDCLDNLGIDIEWLIDYEKALNALNGELIL